MTVPRVAQRMEIIQRQDESPYRFEPTYETLDRGPMPGNVPRLLNPGMAMDAGLQQHGTRQTWDTLVLHPEMAILIMQGGIPSVGDGMLVPQAYANKYKLGQQRIPAVYVGRAG